MTYDEHVKAIADATAADHEAALTLERAQWLRQEAGNALAQAHDDLAALTGRRVRAEAGCDPAELSEVGRVARLTAWRAARDPDAVRAAS